MTNTGPRKYSAPTTPVTGSDGKLTWQRDTNGSVRLLSTEELKNDKNDQYIESVSYAVPGRLPGKETLRPQTERRTGDYIVDVVPDGGKPSALFFDPKTYLIVKEQHQDDDLTITTTYSDFKPLNGVTTATTKRVSNGDKKYDETYHTDTDQIGADAPDSLFAMPPVAKNYQWLDPRRLRPTIPYDAERPQPSTSSSASTARGRTSSWTAAPATWRSPSGPRTC